MKNILLILVLAGCATTRQFPQGIEGQIFWLGGNQMPGPGMKASPRLGISREILIYSVTKAADATLQDQFYTGLRTELVATVTSKDDGTFKVHLPPGQYSVFTKEPKGLFANITDGNGCISCVTISDRKYTHLAFTVDYEAAY